MYFVVYLYQHFKRLNPQKNIIINDNSNKRKRMLINLKRSYLKNIILKLRKYE